MPHSYLLLSNQCLYRVGSHTLGRTSYKIKCIVCFLCRAQGHQQGLVESLLHLLYSLQTVYTVTRKGQKDNPVFRRLAVAGITQHFGARTQWVESLQVSMKAQLWPPGSADSLHPADMNETVQLHSKTWLTS